MTKREIKEAKCARKIALKEVNMMLFYLKRLRFLSKAKFPEEEPVKSSIEIMKNDYNTWAEKFEGDKTEAYKAIRLIRSGEFSRKAKRFGKTAMPSHC